LQILTRKLEELVPYENNPRKNDHAVEAVATAIKEFGFRVPILILSNNQIVDGHLRYKAAKAAGLVEVPCMLADDMSEAQIKAFRISVNKVAELAKWDEELLAIELQALGDVDFDLSSIGFTEAEFDDLLGDPAPGGDKDAVPDVPAVPVSMAGDIWICGEHTVMCGDATSVQDMNTLNGGGVR